MIAASWRDWGICKFKFLAYHIDKFTFLYLSFFIQYLYYITAVGVWNITSFADKKVLENLFTHH